MLRCVLTSRSLKTDRSVSEEIARGQEERKCFFHRSDAIDKEKPRITALLFCKGLMLCFEVLTQHEPISLLRDDEYFFAVAFCRQNVFVVDFLYSHLFI